MGNVGGDGDGDRRKPDSWLEIASPVHDRTVDDSAIDAVEVGVNLLECWGMQQLRGETMGVRG